MVQDNGKLRDCGGVIAIQRDRLFRLDLSLRQLVLRSVEHPHHVMRPGAAGIAPERFGEKLFGARLILLRGGGPTFEDIANENMGHADPRIDRARIDRQRSLEGLQALLPVLYRNWPQQQRPPQHDQIAGIGIDLLFRFEPLPRRSDELQVERAGEPPGDLALRLREVAPIGLEPKDARRVRYRSIAR